MLFITVQNKCLYSEMTCFSLTEVLHDELRALTQSSSAHLQSDVSVAIRRGQAEQGAVGDPGAHQQLDPCASSAEDAPWLIMDPAVPSESPFWKNCAQHTKSKGKLQKWLFPQISAL